jgi:hypothetical protein
VRVRVLCGLLVVLLEALLMHALLRSLPWSSERPPYSIPLHRERHEVWQPAHVPGPALAQDACRGTGRELRTLRCVPVCLDLLPRRPLQAVSFLTAVCVGVVVVLVAPC